MSTLYSHTFKPTFWSYRPLLILLVKYTKSDCTCEFYYFNTCGWFKLGNNPSILTKFLVSIIQSIHYNSPFPFVNPYILCPYIYLLCFTLITLYTVLCVICYIVLLILLLFIVLCMLFL